MKIAAIIQARMGSTRLPGKMMMKIGRKPAVQLVVDRVKMSRLASEVILATTLDSEDDILANWASEHNTVCFRGSAEDVLDRYYNAAKNAKADVIIRVTGDCPFADFTIIDNVVEEYLSCNFDYVSNTIKPTYPDGLDVEVFSFLALEKAWNDAKLLSEREHVTPYIWKHPDLFRIKNVTNAEDFSGMRWTLDTEDDLKFLRKVAEICDNETEFCGFIKIISILKNNSELENINANHKRNEGYAKSLKND